MEFTGYSSYTKPKTFTTKPKKLCRVKAETQRETGKVPNPNVMLLPVTTVIQEIIVEAYVMSRIEVESII